MGFSKFFLNFLHAIVFIIGAAVTSISIYVLVEGSSYLPQDHGVSEWYAWVPFSLGLALMFFAVLGCCCTKEGNTCFLTFYGILQFISGVVIIATGSLIIVSIHRYLYNVAYTPDVSPGLEEGAGGVQRNFGDFMLGLYEGCCKPLENDTSINACPDVLVEGNRKFCHNNIEYFNDGFAAGSKAQSYCEQFTQECASSRPVDSFLVANYVFMEQNILPGGIALVVFGSFLFFAAFFSCHVGCKKEKKQKKSYQETGQNIAYGGQQMTYA